MWCPQCRSEYRDGITVCNDCGVPLVKTLPVEIDPSPAQHQARALDRADSLEHMRALSDGNKAYVEMQAKYEDMKSTAYSFILVGAAGLILMALIFAGMIPLQFAAYMKSIMGVVMGGMFFLFLVIGIRSYMQLGGMKQKVLKETEDTEAAKNWFFDQFSAKSVDVSLDIQKQEPLQQKFFRRSHFIKQQLQGQFPDFAEPFVDYLAEQFYEELFPQD